MLNKTSNDPVIIETGKAPKACVVWLHGLGADGHDFEPIVPALPLPENLAVRFIFPHAPMRPVTINGGMRMRAWYDIAGVDIASKQDTAGIRASAEQVEALLDAQLNDGIAADRLILAGFSQGGAMALHTGLRYHKSLAGIMALSCYLPLHESLEAQRSAANRGTPILMAHGSEDPVVPQMLGERSRDYLREQGYDVEWHSYPMAHMVCPQEIAAIGEWLSARFTSDC